MRAVNRNRREDINLFHAPRKLKDERTRFFFLFFLDIFCSDLVETEMEINQFLATTRDISKRFRLSLHYSVDKKREEVSTTQIVGRSHNLFRCRWRHSPFTHYHKIVLPSLLSHIFFSVGASIVPGYYRRSFEFTLISIWMATVAADNEHKLTGKLSLCRRRIHGNFG